MSSPPCSSSLRSWRHQDQCSVQCPALSMMVGDSPLLEPGGVLSSKRGENWVSKMLLLPTRFKWIVREEFLYSLKLNMELDRCIFLGLLKSCKFSTIYKAKIYIPHIVYCNHDVIKYVTCQVLHNNEIVNDKHFMQNNHLKWPILDLCCLKKRTVSIRNVYNST